MNKLKFLFQKNMILALLMGFAAGLPLALTGKTLQAWMFEANMNIEEIGLFALIGLPYTIKFLWAPFFDMNPFGKFGRRRGWLLTNQVLLASSIFILSLMTPNKAPVLLAFIGLLTCFFSASQDIVIDAYRRDSLKDNELGMGSAYYTYGYRVAMLMSGAFALYMAEFMSWSMVYMVMALTMVPCILVSLWADEPKIEKEPPKSLKQTVIDPFKEFFTRSKLKVAFGILLFILLYKIGDTMAGNMTMPFYLDMGFSKAEVAAIAKVFGFFSSMGGFFIGGLLIAYLGIYRCLWIFGILQSLSTFSFVAIPKVVNVGTIGDTLMFQKLSGMFGFFQPVIDFFLSLVQDFTAGQIVLAAVIGFEDLSGGMGTAVFIAYMASVCNKRYSAAQYALLTSLMGVPRVIISSVTGYMVAYQGWIEFYITCGLLAVPGLLLLLYLKPHTVGKNGELTS
ncbi:MAG: AmpG family muropeptide MFS transporter [Bdellovibrionales bacterium]|nr:AmpG family muropeptide MFS transporter [Bdellovibrionales bacterium]